MANNDDTVSSLSGDGPVWVGIDLAENQEKTIAAGKEDQNKNAAAMRRVRIRRGPAVVDKRDQKLYAAGHADGYQKGRKDGEAMATRMHNATRYSDTFTHVVGKDSSTTHVVITNLGPNLRGFTPVSYRLDFSVEHDFLTQSYTIWVRVQRGDRGRVYAFSVNVDRDVLLNPGTSVDEFDRLAGVLVYGLIHQAAFHVDVPLLCEGLCNTLFPTEPGHYAILPACRVNAESRDRLYLRLLAMTIGEL